MKYIFPLLNILLFLVSCQEQKLNHKETVGRYYDDFDAGNYDMIKATINDCITQVSGDFVTTYSRDGFYEFFKWDSIFKSPYEIIEMEKENDHLSVTVAQKNFRYEFLRNNLLRYKVKVSFTSGKIFKLEDLEYIDTNWGVWNKEKDSLVGWLRNNHPDLDSFFNEWIYR